MSTPPNLLSFYSPQLPAWLANCDEATLDELPFGVIGFDASTQVQRYNRYESKAARFERSNVVGQQVFVELAPCLNNYLVAGRFEEAQSAGVALDLVLPYVLTFRMRPTPVRLRLLARPGESLRHILVERQGVPA